MKDVKAEIKNIENLLNQVSLIKKNYDKINEITGANYNVFNILQMQSDEVRLHSRFLGDLLNPKGKHGRGNVFLKLFVEKLKVIIAGTAEIESETEDNLKDEEKAKYKAEREARLKSLNDFSISNAKIEVEKGIGPIRENTTKGGQIDLVIDDNNGNTIIIENKIYAEDQENQLLRYHNYDKNATLIYLTLDGSDASDYSIGNNKLSYFSISYTNHILGWIEQCIKETTNLPHMFAK